jgi:hypothetical protein
MNTRALFLTAVIILFAGSATASVFRMVTGDYTTINPDWSACENGWAFDTVESGSPSQPLVSTQHYAGNFSIQIQVPTDTAGNKERFEYVIAHATDPDGLHFDNSRYCGFAFKLGSPGSAFLGSDLFWQAWQGSPWGPPASLKLTADSSAPFTIGLYIRNMATGPDSAVSDIKLWSSAIIQPDVWYSVVIYISPRYTNNAGNIKLWLNGTNFVNTTTNIGYDPILVTNALNGLDIKNGIYQPDSNNGHTMYFDQIMFADSYAEAAATPLSANTVPSAGAGNATILLNSFADVDLAWLTHDSETVSTQCLYSISGTNGAAALLADGHTSRLSPATNFVGTTTYTYTATDEGEDPREFLHYTFEPPGAGTNGYVTDNSGHFRDGNLLAIGSGAFSFSTNAPFPNYNSGSLQLTKSGSANAARLARCISNPAELNLSDSSWSFGGWFERNAATNNDFIFYIGTGDGFGGDGDELQLYCPNGSSTLALQHYNTNNVLDLNVSSLTTASTGSWHHAALVFQRTNHNAGILRAYLDGMGFAAANVAWALKQQMPIVFGGHNSTNSHLDRWFGGWLADVVLFTNALSVSEISSLANRTVSQFGGLTATNLITLAVTNYPPPVLSSPAVSNAALTALVNGSAGAVYTIESSTNLRNWTPLFSTNPLTLPFRFADPVSNSLKARFYRAVIAP